jgi:hypothetical protein
VRFKHVAMCDAVVSMSTSVDVVPPSRAIIAVVSRGVRH